MRVVPVLDLLKGVVVRGVAGRRSEYRPVVSRLTSRTDPLGVARALRVEYGLDTFYVADLDAILRARPDWNAYRELVDDGFTLWIDAGLREVETAEKLLAQGAAAVIAGLETWPGAPALSQLCAATGSERLIFSLDLQEGMSLGHRQWWPDDNPERIAARVAAAGVRRLIVLDLAGVGVNNGVGTLDLCRRLRAVHPGCELTTGGGVRHADDLGALRDAGIDNVLIASALHDGHVTRGDLEGNPPCT